MRTQKLLTFLFNAQARPGLLLRPRPLRCRGQKAEASLKKLWMHGCFGKDE